MDKKKLLIGVLGTLNAVLLVMLLAQAALLPAAMAQPARAGGTGYVCATGRISARTFEALHVIDLGARKLHTFVPDRGQVVATNAPRDLEKDFGN